MIFKNIDFIIAENFKIMSQGLDSKINGTRVITFFNSKGVFLRHPQLQLRSSDKCVFAVIKELKGLL